MGQRTKILFASGEVKPFVKDRQVGRTEIASIVRELSQYLHDGGKYEVRIIMPRYGLINERRNRLHEVIRLCGTPLMVGSRKETLNVKVASIPGIRLQVYFMDSKFYFKRKGLYQDTEGVVFRDNVARSLFFGRAAIETLHKWSWKPAVVHSLGWVSGFLPYLISEASEDDELLRGTRVVYTPDAEPANDTLSAAVAKRLRMTIPQEDIGARMHSFGMKYADAVAIPSSINPNDLAAIPENGYEHLSSELVPMARQAMSLYGG